MPGSWPNHVSMTIVSDVMPETIWNASLYEARSVGVTGPGHNARTIQQCVAGGDSVEVYSVLASGEEVKIAEEFLKKQLGKKYDTVGVWSSFIPLKLAQAIAKQSQREADGAWWCSEIVQAATAKLRFPLLVNIQPFQVTPRDLHIAANKDLVWKYYHAGAK
jgi:hypothetical protein